MSSRHSHDTVSIASVPYVKPQSTDRQSAVHCSPVPSYCTPSSAVHPQTRRPPRSAFVSVPHVMNCQVAPGSCASNPAASSTKQTRPSCCRCGHVGTMVAFLQRQHIFSMGPTSSVGDSTAGGCCGGRHLGPVVARHRGRQLPRPAASTLIRLATMDAKARTAVERAVEKLEAGATELK